MPLLKESVKIVEKCSMLSLSAKDPCWTFERASEDEKVTDMKLYAEKENILVSKNRPFFENTSRYKHSL